MINEIRQTIRSILRRPGFALLVIATLAIGIGAATSIFSVVDGVLWRSLPYHQPERLLTIWESDALSGGEKLDVGPANFLDLRERLDSFSGVAAAQPSGYDMVTGGFPETVSAHRVTEEWFEILGIEPLMGRTFLPEEHTDGANRSVILSHEFWRDRYGSDPGVIGAPIDLDGAPFTIVGVMPPIEGLFSAASFWTPRVTNEQDRANRQSRYLKVVGRLRDGVTPEDAASELGLIAGQLAAEHPNDNEHTRFRAIEAGEHLVGGVRQAFLLLLGSVGMVLLIACANVANLLLVRGTRREREISVRSAMGAGRLRLARQFVLEAAILAIAGGAAGALLGVVATRLIVRLGANTIPRIGEIAPDLRMLGFAIAVTMATALTISLMPAWRLSRASARNALLRGGSRGTEARSGRGLRDGIVVAQIALSFVLLTGAALLGRSFAGLMSVDLGFEPRGTLALQLFIWDRYDTSAARVQFFRTAVEALEAHPRVISAGGSSSVPFAEVRIDIDTAASAAGSERQPEPVWISTATEHYFEAMRTPLLAGRAFDERDGADSSRVAILSRTAARRLFGDEPAIGRSVVTAYRGSVEREVVGIVGDVKHESVVDGEHADIYIPHAQSGDGNMALIVRTDSGEPMTLAKEIQGILWKINPALPIYSTSSLESRVGETLEARRVVLSLLAALSALSLALAGIGIYGVLAFNAQLRTAEVGIRKALGASRSAIARLMLGDGLRLVLAGTLLGAGAAIAMARAIEGMLYGVGGRDSMTYAAIAVVLGVVCVAACWIPARRMMRIDAAIALRHE